MGDVSDINWESPASCISTAAKLWMERKSSTQQMGIKTGTCKGGMGGKPRRLSSSSLCSLLVPGIVFDLSIDGNLYVKGTVVVVWDDMTVIVGIFTLRIENAAFAVAINFGALLANLTDGVGLVRVGIDVENGVGGVSGVRAGGAGTSGRRMGCGVGPRERSTGNERAANGENDAHSHGGGKNGGHAKGSLESVLRLGWSKLPCDNGPNSIIGASRLDDKPEQDIGDVNNPDGLW